MTLHPTEQDTCSADSALPLGAADFEAARERAAPHIHHPPLLTSRMLSETTGFDVRLKAEMFQRTGSYKIRGPLNKLTHLTGEQRARGVICSSAGNHALHGLVKVPPGTRVASVLSGGNVNLDQLRGLRWN